MKSNPSIHSSVRHSRSSVLSGTNLQNSLETFHERTISNPVIADIRNSMINLQNEFKEKIEEKLPSNRASKISNRLSDTGKSVLSTNSFVAPPLSRVTELSESLPPSKPQTVFTLESEKPKTVEELTVPETPLSLPITPLPHKSVPFIPSSPISDYSSISSSSSRSSRSSYSASSYSTSSSVSSSTGYSYNSHLPSRYQPPPQPPPPPPQQQYPYQYYDYQQPPLQPPPPPPIPPYYYYYPPPQPPPQPNEDILEQYKRMLKEQEELQKEREKQQKLIQEMELERQRQQNELLFRQQLLLQQHTCNINTELDDLKTYVRAKLNGEPTPPPSPKKKIDPNIFLQPPPPPQQQLQNTLVANTDPLETLPQQQQQQLQKSYHFDKTHKSKHSSYSSHSSSFSSSQSSISSYTTSYSTTPYTTIKNTNDNNDNTNNNESKISASNNNNSSNRNKSYVLGGDKISQNMSYESRLVGRKKKGIQPLLPSDEPIKTFNNAYKSQSYYIPNKKKKEEEEEKKQEEEKKDNENEAKEEEKKDGEEENKEEEEEEEEVIVRKVSLPQQALVNPFLPKSKTSTSLINQTPIPLQSIPLSPSHKENSISIQKEESMIQQQQNQDEKQQSIQQSPIQSPSKSPDLFFPEVKEDNGENDGEKGKNPHKMLSNAMKKKMRAVGVVENQMKRNKEYTNIGFVLDYLTTKRPMTVPVCEISLFKKDDPNNILVEYTSPPAIMKDESYVWDKIQNLSRNLDPAENDTILIKIYSNSRLRYWNCLNLIGVNNRILYRKKFLDLNDPPINLKDFQLCKPSQDSARIVLTVYNPRIETYKNADTFTVNSNPFIYHTNPATSDDNLFTITDGVDIYCDGIRSLPDNVLASKCNMLVYSENKEKLCGLVSEISKPNDNNYLFDPEFSYKFKIELRNPHINGSATLIVRIDAVEDITKVVKVVGYACINLFRLPKTGLQPKMSDIHYLLNEGSWQIPVYEGPYNIKEYSKIRSDDLNRNNNRLPCTTVLIRIVNAPKDPITGYCYNVANFREEEAIEKGVLKPSIPYCHCQYDSSFCKPIAVSETKLYDKRRNRVNPLICDTLRIIYPSTISLRNYEEMISALTKTFEVRPDQYINYDLICEYNSTMGFEYSILSLHGIKSKNVCKIVSANIPPGLYFTPHNDGTNVSFTETIDWNSKVGNIYYQNHLCHNCLVEYNDNLVIIFEIYEYNYKSKKNNMKRVGWSYFPIFYSKKKYIRSGKYVLPVFKGEFPRKLLHDFLENNCELVVKHNFKESLFSSGCIEYLEYASLIVMFKDSQLNDCYDYAKCERKLNLIPDKSFDEYIANIRDLNDPDDPNEKLSKYIPKGYGSETYEKLINDEMQEIVNHK